MIHECTTVSEEYFSFFVVIVCFEQENSNLSLQKNTEKNVFGMLITPYNTESEFENVEERLLESILVSLCQKLTTQL